VSGVVVLTTYAGRAPYELLVAPLACERDGFGSSAFSAAVHALVEAIRRLRVLVPNAPLNIWLHTFTGGENHWHFEVLPRLAVFAGLELGAGLYVNTLAPESAAEQLRAARAPLGPGDA
jgi:UDPglucose--hexose-1-phosphate uridylyltransferase